VAPSNNVPVPQLSLSRFYDAAAIYAPDKWHVLAKVPAPHGGL
jgi:hypothetical protein